MHIQVHGQFLKKIEQSEINHFYNQIYLYNIKYQTLFHKRTLDICLFILIEVYCKSNIKLLLFGEIYERKT